MSLNYSNAIEAKVRMANAIDNAHNGFLTRMSHEIRTPMNAICGMADLLLQSGLQGLELGYANTIKEASDTLLGIMDNMIDILKMKAGEVELFPDEYEPRALIEEIVGDMYQKLEKSSISFRLYIDENLPEVLFGDVLRIRQILCQLLSNAVKYTDKGFISLSVAVEESESLQEALLKFEVEDSGIGIGSEDAEHIFDSFFRADIAKNQKEKGAGLGLFICKQLAEYMGGEIRVKSDLAVGSVFTFCVRQEIRSQRALPEESNRHGALALVSEKSEGIVRCVQKFIAPHLKLLLIDDNPVNLKVAQGLLSVYQCKIASVASGIEALDLLKEEPDFDLLFIDHMMPELDGIETLHRIRNELGEYGRSVTAVALTANVMPEAQNIFKKEGFQAFLAKPISISHMHEIMNRYVAEDKKQTLDEDAAISGMRAKLSKEDIQRVAMKGIDVEIGLRSCGNKVDEYLKILEVALESGKIKVRDLERYAKEKNYEAYGIEAHAFKSVAASIGAMRQSDLARKHEFAVKHKQYEIVDAEYQKLINSYQVLLSQIQGTLDKEENRTDNNTKKIVVDETKWKSKIRETIDAIEDFNQKKAGRLLLELCHYKLPDEVSSAVLEAKQKMKLYEDEAAEQILQKIINGNENRNREDKSVIKN